MWHAIRSEINVNAGDECDCWLGVVWDAADDRWQAERIAQKHDEMFLPQTQVT